MNPQKNPSTICACCSRPLEPGKVYFRHDCWFQVPAKDRVALYQMHARKQDTTAKVASIVKKLHAKRADDQSRGAAGLAGS